MVSSAAAAFDGCRDWAVDGARSAAAWLAGETRLPKVECRRRARLWEGVLHTARCPDRSDREGVLMQASDTRSGCLGQPNEGMAASDDEVPGMRHRISVRHEQQMDRLVDHRVRVQLDEGAIGDERSIERRVAA